MDGAVEDVRIAYVGYLRKRAEIQVLEHLSTPFDDSVRAHPIPRREDYTCNLDRSHVVTDVSSLYPAVPRSTHKDGNVTERIDRVSLGFHRSDVYHP